MSLPLYLDIHVPRGITDGLRARKVAILTAQDDDHPRADYFTILTRATALGRVLFTRDQEFLRIGAAWQRKSTPFAGIIFANQLRVSVPQCVLDLALIAEQAQPEDLANHVEHLPL